MSQGKKIVSVFRRLLKERGISVILTSAAFVLLYALDGGLTVALPSLIIYVLTEQEQVIWIVFAIAAAVSVSLLTTLLGNNYKKNLMNYRLKEAANLNTACLRTSFSFMESEEGQRKLASAQNAVSSGNDIGLEAYLNGIIRFCASALTVILYLLLSVKLPWQMLLILLLGPMIKIPLETRQLKREEKELEKMSDTWEVDERLKRTCQDPGFGKESRIYSLYGYMNAKMSAVNENVEHFNRKIQSEKFIITVSYRFLALIIECIVFFCFALLSRLHIDSYYFVLYLGIILSLDRQVEGCYQNYYEIRRNSLYVTNFLSFFRLPAYDETEASAALPVPPYELTFDHVFFRYQQKEASYVLNDVSFSIRNGEKIALVGRNGSGKTTLIKLLCGLYKPQKGKILLNGIDIQTIPVREYDKLLSVVFQNPALMAMSLGENITCCTKGEANQALLDNVVQQAGLTEVVQKAPKGLDTPLTNWLEDDGISLSGGETQKVMLARALYKKGKILILDEPAASLDPIAEAELYTRYQKLAESRLSVFVSHRLCSTQFCDRILFLENGRIIQQGSHEELLCDPGPYRELYHLQSGYYEEEACRIE